MADNATQIVITARDDTARAFESVKGALGGIESAASRLPMLGTALAGVLSVGAFTSGIQSAIKFAASLDDMAERTGASVESLSALAKVAKIGGHDIGLVETAAIRLSKAMAGADDEAKGAGHALEVLGLKAEDLRGLDTADALKQVADALAQYRDGSGKTALAMDLFGRSGAQLLPLLKDLAEVSQLNGRVTAEQAAMAEKYEKAMNKLQGALGETTKSVAMGLLPGLSRLTEQMNEGIRIAGGLGSALLTLGSINPFRSLGGNIAHYSAEIERLKAGNLGPVERSIVAVRGQGAIDEMIRLNEQKLEFLKFQQRQEALALTEGKRGRLDAKDLGPAGLSLDYKSKVDGAAKTAKALGSVNDYEMRIGEMVGNAIGNADIIKAAEYAAVQARLLDMLNKGQISEELYAGALMKTSHAQGLVSDEAERFNKLLAATPTAKIEEQRKDMQMLAAALEAGRISEKEFIEAAQTRLGTLGDGIREVDDFARQMGLTFSSAFEDAIVGGKSLSDVLKGLAQDIARIVIRQTVTEPIGSAISGAIKGSGVLDGVKDFFGSIFGGGRASGGPVSAGSLYLVGENGPELFAPGTSGTIVPNGGGGGVTVNLIEAPGKGGQVRERSGGGGRVLDITVESIKAAVAQDIMRGAGPVPAAMQAAYGLGRVGSA